MGEWAAEGLERGRPPQSPPHRLSQGRPCVGTSCLKGAWERPARVPGGAQPTAWGEGAPGGPASEDPPQTAPWDTTGCVSWAGPAISVG